MIPQDLLVQEARSSWESQQDAESYGETRSNTADYRVQGISISTVKLQDARRQNNVTKPIDVFEKKHRHEEQFLKDMELKAGDQQVLRGITTKYSKDMNNTEIFELCRELCKTSMS